MVAIEAWFDRDATEPTIVDTPAGLDAVLDTVAGWPGPNTVQLLIADDPGRAILDEGLNAEYGRGVLYYSGPDAPDGVTGKGPDVADPLPIYYFAGSDTEYPADAEIPLDVVRRAAHEYMTSGGARPTGIEWQSR